MNGNDSTNARRRLAGMLALVLATLAGCGDDSATSGGGGSGGAGAGGGVLGGGGSAGGSDSLTFIVVESISGDPTPVPLAEATVAFDAPGGERIELMSGADGKVTFDGIDWSLGQAAATAYLDGYTLFSSVNLDEARLAQQGFVEDAVPLFLIDQSPPTQEMVLVSGTVTGLEDTTHALVVNVVETQVAILGTSQWMGAGTATFTVAVPKGEPFTLQAVERSQDQILPSGQGYDMAIHQWMQQSFSATPDDLSGAVLDFGTNALAMQTAEISVDTPMRADSPVRAGFGVGLVCPGNAYYCTGWSTHIDIAADGSRFDDSLVWVEPEWAEDPVTVIQVFDGQDLISFRQASGWPATGSIGALPDTAEWTVPADTSATHPLHEPVAWQLFDADVPHVSLHLLHGPNGPQANQLAWIVDAGPNATGATVPQPPSGVDLEALTGTSARGFVFAGWPGDELATFEAFSQSEQIRMAP